MVRSSTPDTPPAPTSGPKAWMGSELSAGPEAWTRWWTDAQIEAVLEGAAGIDDTDPVGSRRGEPDVPALRQLADCIRAELVDGLGFTLLRGFPIDEVDHRTAALSFVALGRQVGSLRSQNADGHLLGHVRDVGADPGRSETRIYQTNARQTFHTDSSDAVALMCIRPARSGGRSMLASAESVYRIIHERRPDLAARLFDPIATDRRGEKATGQDPWYEIPVLSWFDERLTVQYQRQYIDSAARFAAAPVPDPRQIEALDLFDEVVNEPDVSLEMNLERGDIQFVYNHSLLHDRTGFTDHADPRRRRHLLRLWLALPEDRELPPVFAERYGSVTVGDRGGIVTDETQPCIPIDA